MKKLLLLLLLVPLISCVIIRFPQKVNVDITVPADFDVNKMEILVDTLVSKNEKIKGTLEFSIKKEKNKKPPKVN